MEDLVNNFYNEIINEEDFNGNYFEAMLNAIVMAKGFVFLKSCFERSNNEKE